MRDVAQSNVLSNTQVAASIATVLVNGVVISQIKNSPLALAITAITMALSAGFLVSKLSNSDQKQKEQLSQSTLFTIGKNTLLIQSANIVAELVQLSR